MSDELIKLDPGAIRKAEWIEERDELLGIIEKVKSVDTDNDLKQSGKLQTRASKHLKKLEEERKKVKAPITAAGKLVDGYAKELREDLESEIARIKKLNGDYATKKAEEAEAERRRIADEEAAKAAEQTNHPTLFGGMEVEMEPQEIIRPVEPLPTGKVSTGANAMVKVWEFEIVNAKAIPRDFLSVDQSKIRNYMNYKTKMGETPEIPGICFSSRVDVRSR